MRKSFTVFAAGIAVFVVVAAASMVGSMVGQSWNPDSDRTPFVLNADTASSGESLSMATGLVDRDRFVEGLFVLDHLSGVLQCWVVNPRTGDIGGLYSTNVNDHLDLPKGGDTDFVMTTGNIKIENAQARRGNLLPAGCICYVAEGNTGKVVGFTLFYDRQLVLNNGSQEGELELIVRGFAREAGLKRDR